MRVAVNPCALDFDDELRRFRWKVEAGAEFAVTHSVFDVADLEALLGRIEGHRVPLLAGIQPLESLRQAEYLANEVPGVRVPGRHLERMREAEQAGRAHEEGVAIAVELARALQPLVQGVQIWATGGRFDAVTAVVGALHARA